MKERDVLYVLDSVKYEAAVKSAEAKVAETKALQQYAERNYARHLKLVDSRAVSQDAVDNSLSARDSARAALAAAQADLAEKRDSLDHCRITAPISGKVGTTQYTRGNYVTTSSGTLVTLVQNAPIRVRFSISNREYLEMFGGATKSLRQDGVVSLVLADGREYDEPGEIEYTENASDERTDTMQVYALFKNDSFNLKPGDEDKIEGIFQELDFTVEANNIKQGTVYTSGVVKDAVAGVRSMELYPSINATANTLVLRKAPGVTYDRFVAQSKAKVAGIVSSFERVRNEDGTVTYKSGDMTKVFRARRNLITAYDEVHARQKRLVGFMEKWAYEAIFGDGFFHGDVHAGNLMCDASTLTVIDYGNASRLSETDRENLKWGLAWIPARNAKNFISYYEKLLSADGKKSLNACRGELVRNLQSLFDRSDVSDAGRVMAAAFQLIQQMDVELPGPIFNMMQSMQRLDETARLLNEQMENIRTTVESLELTADLQPGETLPAFLQPFHEMAHSEKKIGDGTDVTFKDLFQMMAKRIRVGDIPTDEDGFLNIDNKGGTFITELTSYGLSDRREEPSPRYQDHLEDLVKAVFDSEAPDTAKAALFGEFDQLKALATSLVNESDPNLAIVASDLLGALAQQPASMEAGDRDAWMAFASKLAIKVGQTNGAMFEICSLTMPTRMHIMNWKSYKLHRFQDRSSPRRQ